MAIGPKDILPDDQNTGKFDNVTVRKGTIKAFIDNIDILESTTASEQEKQLALVKMKELAPGLIALGMHRHVIFKNPQAEQILMSADSE